MERQWKGWLAAIAVAVALSNAQAASPPRAPLEARLGVRAEDVNIALSGDSRLFIGRCADCERLVFAFTPATQYSLNGEAVGWSALRAYLSANPGAALQVTYEVRRLVVTRVSATGR